jgi:hypothetical protein
MRNNNGRTRGARLNNTQTQAALEAELAKAKAELEKELAKVKAELEEALASKRPLINITGDVNINLCVHKKSE